MTKLGNAPKLAKMAKSSECGTGTVKSLLGSILTFRYFCVFLDISGGGGVVCDFFRIISDKKTVYKKGKQGKNMKMCDRKKVMCDLSTVKVHDIKCI